MGTFTRGNIGIGGGTYEYCRYLEVKTGVFINFGGKISRLAVRGTPFSPLKHRRSWFLYDYMLLLDIVLYWHFREPNMQKWYF